MTRTRASARAAGTRFASAISMYLARHLDDDRIERRALTGARDRGDVAGIRVHGKKVVVEAKDCARLSLGPWAAEAEQERINDAALVGVVISKRHGKGQAGDQWVHMTLRDFCALISGVRPDDDQPRETTND